MYREMLDTHILPVPVRIDGESEKLGELPVASITRR
jgi:hypothetical protein